LVSSTGLFTLAALLATSSVAAQRGASAARCPDGRLEADLGFGGLECVSCTLRTGGSTTNRGRFEYAQPPRILGVRSSGVAADRLFDGDVLLRVNGISITTDAGAWEFEHVRPGRPTVFSVRRRERIIDVSIVAEPRCVQDAASSNLGTLSKRTTEPAGGRPWLGVALSCSECEVMEQGGTRAWSFHAWPVLAEVSSMGPAARAGLESGDSLTSVDGLTLLSSEGGRRFASLEPGQQIVLTYRRAGREGSARVTVGNAPASSSNAGDGDLQFSGTVGGVDVEVRGAGARVISDERSGTLEVRGENISVRIRPTPKSSTRPDRGLMERR
jgi:hypothetical protein